MIKTIQQIKTLHLFLPIRVLIVLMGTLFLVGIVRADSISDHRFSMTLREQPMAEVFQKLSTTSALEIIYNEALQNQRVTVHLENATIEKALQKILSHSNYTIIYDQNKTIQVDVYDSGTPDIRRSRTSVARKTPRQLLRKSMSQATIPTQTPVSSRPLTADEQYWADEKAAGNIP